MSQTGDELRLNRPCPRPAHVYMGDVQHTECVTREMALDAGQPELEGYALDAGTEEVWEDHEVCLAEDVGTWTADALEIIDNLTAKLGRARADAREEVAQSFELAIPDIPHDISRKVIARIRALTTEAP